MRQFHWENQVMLTPDYQCRLHKEEIVAINIYSDQTIRMNIITSDFFP